MKNSLKKDKSQDYGSSDLERDVTNWLIPLPSPPLPSPPPRFIGIIDSGGNRPQYLGAQWVTGKILILKILVSARIAEPR
jgi:hypothetical protein